MTTNDDRLIVPLTTLQERLTGSTHPSVIYASAVSSDQMQQAQQDIELTLRKDHGLGYADPDDFVITNQATILDTLQGVTQALQSFPGGIAGISLLVGGIGIMNIMLVSVTERTREIGLRKALGATRGAILRQFLIESSLVGLIGGAVGVLLGWGGAAVYGQVTGSTVSVNLSAVWTAFIVALIVGLVFGIYPALRASRLSPINALRYE
jgi:putative ABC transport system permease protein